MSVLKVKNEDGTWSILSGLGQKGAPGEDGYTPIKGVDYWTEEDKAEIKEYIDSVMLSFKQEFLQGEW